MRKGSRLFIQQQHSALRRRNPGAKEKEAAKHELLEESSNLKGDLSFLWESAQNAEKNIAELMDAIVTLVVDRTTSHQYAILVQVRVHVRVHIIVQYMK